MPVPNKREWNIFDGFRLNFIKSISTDIHWPGSSDGAPPDLPPCGFLGNDPNCQNNGIRDVDCRRIALLLFGCFIFIFSCDVAAKFREQIV